MLLFDVTFATANGKSVAFGPITAPDAATAERSVIRLGLRVMNYKCGGWFTVTAAPVK